MDKERTEQFIVDTKKKKEGDQEHVFANALKLLSYSVII